MNPPWLRTGPGYVTLQVGARPGAGRCKVVRADARGLVVALNTSPDKGKANEELTDFLARLIGVPRSAVTIVRGASARQKLLRIATETPDALANRLRSLADGNQVA